MSVLFLVLQLSTTNCIGTAHGGMNCTTMAPPSYQAAPTDGDASLGTGLGELLTGTGDRHVKRQIGKMLANGDCAGAEKYALTKGRLDLAQQVRSYCGR
jgi:hypothetical protein